MQGRLFEETAGVFRGLASRGEGLSGRGRGLRRWLLALYCLSSDLGRSGSGGLKPRKEREGLVPDWTRAEVLFGAALGFGPMAAGLGRAWRQERPGVEAGLGARVLLSLLQRTGRPPQARRAWERQGVLTGAGGTSGKVQSADVGCSHQG